MSIKKRMIGGTILDDTSIVLCVTILSNKMFEIRGNKVDGLVLILFFTESAHPDNVPFSINILERCMFFILSKWINTSRVSKARQFGHWVKLYLVDLTKDILAKSTLIVLIESSLWSSEIRITGEVGSSILSFYQALITLLFGDFLMALIKFIKSQKLKSIFLRNLIKFDIFFIA